MPNRQPPLLPARGGHGRDPAGEIFRTAGSVALAAAIFAFALPHFASYRSVWASMYAMTWAQALLIAAAAAASMASTWIMICSVLPSIRLREAAVVNLGSNAVANTLPAGGALAMGVSWAMLSSWGVSTAEYVLYTLVSGIWNVFARLGLPVLALMILATAGLAGAGLIAAAAAGLALLTAMAAGLGLLMRSEPFALRAGRALQPALVIACRVVRLAGVRRRPRITARLPPPGRRPDRRARLADHRRHGREQPHLVARAAGVPARRWPIPGPGTLADLPRGLRVRPAADGTAHHPGGLGITELGLIATLAAGAGHRASAQVTAAVLLYRAVTYLPPIPLGAIACLTWRHAPALIHAKAASAGQPTEMSPSGPDPTCCG